MCSVKGPKIRSYLWKLNIHHLSELESLACILKMWRIYSDMSSISLAIFHILEPLSQPVRGKGPHLNNPPVNDYISVGKAFGS